VEGTILKYVEEMEGEIAKKRVWRMEDKEAWKRRLVWFVRNMKNCDKTVKKNEWRKKILDKTRWMKFEAYRR
jgi:hypothetical protein